MGPTIKIAKNMMEKAKSFTMKGVDLIAQLNTKSPDFHAKNSYKPTPFKTSKGLVKGIDFRYNDKQIKKKLAAEEHGITHVNACTWTVDQREPSSYHLIPPSRHSA